MKKLNVISLSSFLIVAVFLSMLSSELSDTNPHSVIASKNLVSRDWITANIQLSAGSIHPSVNITNPSISIFTYFVTLNGTTSDSGGSGIRKVEVAISKVPFNSTASYNLASPTTQGNWSRWSFPIILKETGSYIVKSKVTDNAGDQNWAEGIINFPAYMHDKRFAFVEPTFTYAAYRNGSFYNFYIKYNPISNKLAPGSTITTDLNLLRNRPIPHGPFPYYTHPTQTPDIPYIEYFKILLQHVKKDSPFVTNLTDVDVHQGKIFQTNGENAYDVLFLFHNEYATASEYNNLRKFVSNGGTIVFTEGNTLYVEVSYNKINDSITFVKGHTWKFDGKSVVRSVGERWLDENKNWTGSNYLDINTEKPVQFRNNPFNYKHTEEQYVTNPNAEILINYHASYSKAVQCSTCPVNATVATYQMNYGNGRVIHLGIWGHTLEDNKAFLNYFDNVITPLALGPPIQYLHISYLNIHNASFILVPTTGPSGAVVNYLLPPTISNIEGEFIPVCKPPPGSTFPIGETMVKCTATDKADNNTAIARFTIQVEDMISH